MAKRKAHLSQELPIVFKSGGKQIVGMFHKTDGDKILIMCHGFTGNKMENKRLFVQAARKFASEGLSAMRFDFFGSGDSEGEFEESLLSHNIKNLQDAVAWAGAAGYKKIAVLGISMGAATAILAAPNLHVQALLLWSAVPDLKALFESYVENPGDVFADKEVIEFDGWALKRDFYLDAIQHNVQESLARIEIPKFIAQGTADAPLFVDGFHKFREIVIPPADFMEIPGAGHTYQTIMHRRQVIRQSAIWLERHL